MPIPSSLKRWLQPIIVFSSVGLGVVTFMFSCVYLFVVVAAHDSDVKLFFEKSCNKSIHRPDKPWNGRPCTNWKLEHASGIIVFIFALFQIGHSIGLFLAKKLPRRWMYWIISQSFIAVMLFASVVCTVNVYNDVTRQCDEKVDAVETLQCPGCPRPLRRNPRVINETKLDIVVCVFRHQGNPPDLQTGNLLVIFYVLVILIDFLYAAGSAVAMGLILKFTKSSEDGAPSSTSIGNQLVSSVPTGMVEDANQSPPMDGSKPDVPVPVESQAQE